MIAIQYLSAQPWVGRLGLTLLHFLWQGMLIALLYAIARRWAAQSGPNFRYALACATLTLMAAAPLATWSFEQPPAPEAVGASFAAPLAIRASSAGRSVPSYFSGEYGVVPDQFLPWVVAVWLAGAMALWLRLVGGWIFAERLRSRLVRPAPGDWQQALDRLKTRIRVSRPVRLLVSSMVQAPAVVGWIRPVVLVPIGALSGLPPEHIEALLLHELAHIRRHDYLIGMVQSAVEALLFYHPAVWWVSAHIRAERELCCDDAAIAVHGDLLTYARALSELASARPANAVMAANGGSLAHRIGRLLGESRPAPRTLSAPGVIGTVLLVIGTLVVFGQTGARPKFEVASIRPSDEQRFMTVRPLPGRLTANAPVRLLMQNAYSVQPFQIVGGPDWIGSTHYEIDAKADSRASREQIFLMLQSLLEDRFQLRIRRETREMPVYNLVPARGGLKLPAPKDGGCVDPTPEVPPEFTGGRMPVPGQIPAVAPCGTFRIFLEPGGARMRGGKVPMAEFVRQLSMVLGRSVVDKTGLARLFDLKLEFMPDQTTESLPPLPPDVAGDARSPSIIVALQEQLGLRLESAKGPVDVLVVEHVEQPSAN